MAKKIFSCQNDGIDGRLVEAEVDILQGMPAFSIVGLGDTAVQEAKERIRSAIKNSGADYPRQKKIINLAPASLRKHGPHFDLPMAAGLLAASGQLGTDALEKNIIVGELALDGAVRPIHGVLTMALFARKHGWARMILPAGNVEEARLVKGVELVGISHLKELIAYLKNGTLPTQISLPKRPAPPRPGLTLDDIHGNENAKRALEISAAGGHHLLLSGPPGIGKTVLGKAFASILPPLTDREKLEMMQIHSVAGILQNPIDTRPFRELHPGCTITALIGGGAQLKPGEVSLAHCGVLFLDEIAEFQRAHLESLRQPLEEHEVHLARAIGAITYPARFILIASMNPCPCGYFGDKQKNCSCRPYQVMQYQKKLSGPLLDRIDLTVEVERQSVRKYQKKSEGVHKKCAKQVKHARDIQSRRFNKLGIITNSEMNSRQIQNFCQLDPNGEKFLARAGDLLSFSGRQYYQTLRVARTVADLEGAENIRQKHLNEALQYRHAAKAGFQ